MKPLRIIFLVLGILFLLVEILGYTGGQMKVPDGRAERIEYYIGYNLNLVLALIFFWLAWLIGKKIKKKEKARMLDDFLK